MVFTLPTEHLIGIHNAGNAAAALTALEAVDISPLNHLSTLQAAFESFAPLAHRLEIVAEIDSVIYVDDSLATTPQAAIAALEAFSDRPVSLIAGGHDRGVAYRPLAEHIKHRIEWTAVLTLPDNGPAISRELEDIKAGVTAVDTPDIHAAVKLAADLTPPGGVVLLSPAASSFGQFANYLERSAAFKKAIDSLEDF